MYILRRHFLQQASLALGCSVLGRFPLNAFPAFQKDPFTLGVASGDPLPDGIVLWTRLAPDPLTDGGMPPETVPVQWKIAADEKMSRVVRSGQVLASPASAHSVHVEASGLEPERWYWYQFSVGNRASRILSPVGRTKTAPARDALSDSLSFALASCQKWETGYFTAYQRMAEEELDLVIHVGDYIYEREGTKGAIREHPPEETRTLEQYRRRYALYKTDAHLQRVHAQFPWMVTWDDHEVSNDYAAEIPQRKSDQPSFLNRRAAAYQAYYEHMPLRSSCRPQGNSMNLYRRLQYGSLADIHILDTRQYRSDQPCEGEKSTACPERLREDRTMLGVAQERWLMDGLSRSRASWNILAQQVLFAEVDRDPGSGEAYPLDKWDGYFAARRRLLDFIASRKPSNPVVLTGDSHQNWVFDVKQDFRREQSPIIATEFGGTSISSDGDGVDMRPETARYLPANPHIKFANSQRGYVRMKVGKKLWRSDFRVVPFITRPDAPITTRASFVVESGRPGAITA